MKIRALYSFLFVLVLAALFGPLFAEPAAGSPAVPIDWHAVLAPLASAALAGLVTVVTALVPRVYAKIPRPWLPVVALVLSQVATSIGEASKVMPEGTLKGTGLAVLAILFRSVWKHFTSPEETTQAAVDAPEITDETLFKAINEIAEKFGHKDGVLAASIQSVILRHKSAPNDADVERVATAAVKIALDRIRTGGK